MQSRHVSCSAFPKVITQVSHVSFLLQINAFRVLQKSLKLGKVLEFKNKMLTIKNVAFYSLFGGDTGGGGKM